MYFNEEYELELNDKIYFVKVAGEQGRSGTYFDEFTVYDSLNNRVDEDDENYDDILADAMNRDYEVEEHNTNFNYYSDYDL